MIVTFRAIRSLWRARQRRIDIDILWPCCRDGANDLAHARAAFAMHCFNDPAWIELGYDAIVDFIDGLGATNLPVADRRTIYSEDKDPRLDPDYKPPPKGTRVLLSRSQPPTEGSSGLHRPQD
jgi:hypothetical protein